MAAAPMRAGDDPAELLLSRLSGVRQTGPDRWRADCSGHDDKKAKLGIHRAPDGRLLIICRSHGCTAGEIMAGVGLSLADLFPRPLDHYRGPLPKRSRWDGTDAWRMVAHEAAVAAVAASDAAAGRPVTPEDAARTWLAADRLADAARSLGVAP